MGRGGEGEEGLGVGREGEGLGKGEERREEEGWDQRGAMLNVKDRDNEPHPLVTGSESQETDESHSVLSKGQSTGLRGWGGVSGGTCITQINITAQY